MKAQEQTVLNLIDGLDITFIIPPLLDLYGITDTFQKNAE